VPAANPLCHALVLAGHRGEAEAICRRVLADHADARGRPRAIAWSVRVVLGIVRYEAGDLAEARRELEGGFEDARRLGVGRPMLGWAVPYLAMARQATGSPDAALEALQVSSREAGRTGTALPTTSRETEARILLMQGDIAAAARWADGAAPETPPGSPLQDVMQRSIDITVARVRLAQGRPDEAAVLLARAHAGEEAAGAVADLVSIGVLEAAAAAASGRTPEALRSLSRAVELAAPGGYVRRFVDDGDGVARLLPQVRTVAPAFVDGLASALAEARGAARPQEGGRGGAVSWDRDGRPVEALTAREVEVLRLMASGASNAEIAAGLTVSVGTAKWHVGHVLAKLGAASRTQALVRAQQLGLV
jgi:LuxR family maltose regulon positive regulatory protein